MTEPYPAEEPTMTEPYPAEELAIGDVVAHPDFGTPLEVEDLLDHQTRPDTVFLFVRVRDGGAWSDGNRRVLETSRDTLFAHTEPWSHHDE